MFLFALLLALLSWKSYTCGVSWIGTSSRQSHLKVQKGVPNSVQSLARLFLAFAPGGLSLSLAAETCRFKALTCRDAEMSSPAEAEFACNDEVPSEKIETRVQLLEEIRADYDPQEHFHFFVSNEAKHYLWRESVRDLGGVMVGVGTEQNYLIAGWARPDVLVLMDRDICIPWLHKAYSVAFDLAATPDEFIMLWDDDEASEILETGIGLSFSEAEKVDYILRMIQFSDLVGRKLGEIQASYAALNIPCFLTNQEQYDFVKNLWKQGRVLVIQGDLTGELTMADIARFARKSALPVRVLYMSNVGLREHFPHDRFRANIAGLPLDSRSLVLRTHEPRPWERKTLGSTNVSMDYYTQRIADFLPWLEHENMWAIQTMSKYRTCREDPQDFILDKPPEQVGEKR